MKNALSIQEFKALAELFFNAGKGGEDFELFFDNVMKGRYNKQVQQDALMLMWREMHRKVNDHMECFDREEKMRAANSMEVLRNFIIR